jgi:hypothetical protein
MHKTRKRKLLIRDFNKCNPAVKSKNNKCLPTNVYTKLSKTLRVNKKDVFKKVGCGENEEHCLLDKSPLNEEYKKELRKQFLRTRYPKSWMSDPDMWLDNFNIQHVMKQYEVAYPWFKFLGVFPIDFSAPSPYKKDKVECLYKETCNIDLRQEYAKGTRGIGIVFNLDPHFKGGSHWVGMYINLTKKNNPECFYFDSYGYETPPLIGRLMRSFRLQYPNCSLGYNARRFQYGGSECGMFSMYFLICMIHGISFKEFCKDSVNDKMMLELRQILFAK